MANGNIISASRYRFFEPPYLMIAAPKGGAHDPMLKLQVLPGVLIQYLLAPAAKTKTSSLNQIQLGTS